MLRIFLFWFISCSILEGIHLSYEVICSWNVDVVGLDGRYWLLSSVGSVGVGYRGFSFLIVLEWVRVRDSPFLVWWPWS